VWQWRQQLAVSVLSGSLDSYRTALDWAGAFEELGAEIEALPVGSVLVHVVGDLLNTSTGNIDSEAILSVLLVRKTMTKLKFATLDASDSMNNFVHRMSYHKTKGFLAVTPIDPSEIAMDMAPAAG
jgi:hypothetical protein